MIRNTPTRIDLIQYLQENDPYDAEVVLLIRNIIINSFPALDEGYAYSMLAYKYKTKTLATIAVHREHCNLQLFYGAQLPDPFGLLHGNGKLMRHMKIKTKQDIHEKAIIKYLQNTIDILEE